MMRLSALFLLVALCVSAALAQNAPATPQTANSDPTYQALRHITVGNEAVTVNGVVLNREGAKFTLRSGTVYFLTPVNGKVTGAVFIGDGVMTINPPTQIERNSLGRLTDGKEFSESFSHLVLRFTDGTYDELKKVGTPASGSSGDANGILDSAHSDLKSHLLEPIYERQAGYNFHGRILQDVLSTKTGGLFVAFIRGKNYSDRMLFVLDPHGVRAGFLTTAPEEVLLLTYDPNKFGVWTSYHRLSEYASGAASSNERNNLLYDVHQKLDTTIEKSGYLKGDALTTISAGTDGLRVAELDLFPSLRVKSVTDTTGQPLPFIQEDKFQDPQFFVILPKELAKNEQFTIHTIYEGKEAILNEGGGNYFPIARENWYPYTYFGDYATYDMTFRIPKGLKMVGTGDLISDKIEGDQDVSEWQSTVPIAVAGFNFGKYKRMDMKLPKLGVAIEAYANEEQPDWVRNVQREVSGENPDLPQNKFDVGGMGGIGDAALGNMDTTSLMKKPFSEAQVAAALYTDYFGPMSYKRIAMSQQTSCGFGQSWPTLVYLPMCAMMDTQVRHQFGMDRSFTGVDPTNTYWNAVGAHEAAHQWWGHTVGFNGYRDQWMSEGFAHLSTSIFIQAVYTDNKGDAYHRFWQDMLKELTFRNPQGKRPIDVGPVTLGYRLSTTKSGEIYSQLVYPKGAYILQMIRWMMFDPQTGDQNFKAMMHDFVETYRNKPATTEDFKAIVEKHIQPQMNLTQNGKMDWFFNEYVYGTYLPNERFEYTFGKEADGTPNVHVKLTQSNVDQNFGMLVPLYLEMSNGKIIRVGSAPMVGNTTVDQTIPLAGIKETPKRAMICYNQDVLATIDQK